MKLLSELISKTALTALIVFFSCKEDEVDKGTVFDDVSIARVSAGDAKFRVAFHSGSPSEIFYVFDTDPGLSEDSPNRTPEGADYTLVTGLLANTTYYIKFFAIDGSNAVVSSPEISFRTLEPIIERIPAHGRKGEVVTIGGENFSSNKAENIVKFGDVQAEVTSVFYADELTSSSGVLDVVVPEDLSDLPVQISLSVGGATTTSIGTFFLNNIVVEGFTPEYGRSGDTIKVFGHAFPQEGSIRLGESYYQPSKYHMDPAGDYYTFIVDQNSAPGDYDLFVYFNPDDPSPDALDDPMVEKAPGQFTVLPEQWLQKSDFGGGEREYAISFSIGNKGYIGLGLNSSGLSADIWEYDMNNDTWTRKADFPGTLREKAVSFSVEEKGYVATGDGSGFNTLKDVWEYDPVNDTWTQKNDFSGSARAGATAVVVGNKCYMGLGRQGDGALLDDWWEYNPLNDSWSQMNDFAGGAREFASGFAIADKAYIGLGNENGFSVFNDFWEFDPSSNVWTKRTDFGGSGRFSASSFVIEGRGYVAAGFNESIAGTKDCWQYDPIDDAWAKMQDLRGSKRGASVSFSSSTAGYVLTGIDFANGGFSRMNDMWVFEP